MVKLSSMWERIQSDLFPFLEEELGPLTKKQQQLISILETIRVEDSISNTYIMGRPLADRKAIARAFVAKSVYNSPTTSDILERLKIDKALRRICGWETRGQIPSEATFSRAFCEFSESRILEAVHESTISNHMSDHLVGHISRDSSKIAVREKPAPKMPETPKPKRKRGRPKKGESVAPKEKTRIEKQKTMTLEETLADLPTECDRGTKTNSKGYKETWNGYKLHLDVADGQIPITPLLTSASLHDSQTAIPLATMTCQRVTNLYDLMDSAYDCEEIKEHSRNLGHVPIIDPNRRRGEKRELDPAEKKRYNERTAVERVFGRLKDEFGCRMIRVRGPAKVMAHLMFGILALTADQLLKFVQ